MGSSGPFDRSDWRYALLAAWLGINGATAQTQTPLIGRIIAVDKDSVLIQPEDAGAQPVRVPLGPGDSPGILVSGAQVRLWSDRDAGRQAWRLDAQSHGRLGDVDRDHTGVRSRIGRGAGRGGGGAGGGQHGR